jgi:ComF family protein
VLAIKHLAGESLAECLGRLWARERRSQFEALSTQLLVPIPLHWLRFWERGYNQAEALAWGIAAELGIRCEPRLLCRVRSTPMQTALSVDARRQNVAKSFRVSRWKTAKDLRILLIDDVLTTGSTASAAADALRQAGAAQVDVAVLAHR